MADVDERARRAYRGMAWGFLGIGGAFLLVAVLERVIGFEFFNASPVRVALFLIAIGGALWWTVRKGSGEVEGDGVEAEGARADAVGDLPDGGGESEGERSGRS